MKTTHNILCILALLASATQAAVVSPNLSSLLRQKRVLVLEGSAAGHEDAKANARNKLNLIKTTIQAIEPGFVMTIQQGSVTNVNLTTLNQYDLLVFNYFFETEKTPATFQNALKSWLAVGNGRGWVGYHTSGANDDGEWDWYRDSVTAMRYHVHSTSAQLGNVFWTPDTSVRKLPVMQGLDSTFRNSDEWYDFSYSPTWGDSANWNRNADVRVLYYLDETSLTTKPSRPMNPHPMAWTRVDWRGTRYFYTSLIHTGTGANTDFFHSLILRGMEFAAGYGPTSISLNGRNLGEGKSKLGIAQNGEIHIVADEAYTLNIYSLQGKRVYTTHGTGSQLYRPGALQKAGLYVVQVASRSGNFVEKVIVP